MTSDVGDVDGIGNGGCAAYYGNDGFQDFFVASDFLDNYPLPHRPEQPILLLSNNVDWRFSDVSRLSGAADWGIARGMAYVDFNGYGCLVLYVANLGPSFRLR